MRISKYKNIIPKAYIPKWSEKVFVIKKVKNIVLCKYVINVLDGRENVETFYEKKLQKTSQKKIRVEKLIKRKYDILHVQ